MKKEILFCFFLLVAISIPGCEGPAGPEGHSGQMKYSVFGEVKFISDTLPTNSQVYVSYISSIPMVKLNQDTIKFMYFSGQGSSYWDTLRTITEGDEVQLTVNGNQGVASAIVRIPKQFRIQSPDPDSIFILPPHSNFTSSWTASGFSDYYTAHFHLYYSYTTIGGEATKNFYIDVDTMISTTTITIPAARLFPADFDSLIGWYNHGYFEIEAINGPRIEVGEQGNVTGNGMGFFFGKSNGGNLELMVGNSTTTNVETKLKFDLKREQSERFYKKFLKWQKTNY